ncbi:MAG TPA: amidohydrolase family protein [Tepidisphaeraceae bacterium]|nr:amidohydrolase family protein [Tepidisphaeraceae bacterium]
MNPPQRLSRTIPTVLLARWVISIDRPSIRDGAIAFADGIILTVGTASDVRQAFPRARVHDLGQSALLPGLVNAHVHLELSALSPGEKPAGFVDWLKRLVPASPPSWDGAQAFARGGVEAGVQQCLRFGVTTIGDISRQCAVTRQMLKNTPLRVVSYGEVQAMAQRRGFLHERLETAADRTHQTDRLRVGVSPHAPYSVEIEGFRRCLQVAGAGQLPLATHLAESAEEAPFLTHHHGPFRELWRHLGAWDEQVPFFPGGPIRFAREIGLLDYPTLLAHVNYCDDDELAMLAAGHASVVYCPRTHAYFGHPPHRWRDMLARGINVALGTDSCASSPDLNLLDDLRLLHRIAPDFPPGQLWELATVRAARAIGCENQVGSLAIGKAADFAIFDAPSDDPMREILQNDRLPNEVWINGARQAAGTTARAISTGNSQPTTHHPPTTNY